MGMRKAVIAAVLICCSVSSARADTRLWSSIALEDLAAARALLSENHPGAARSQGDTAFKADLQKGYVAAQARAKSARTYADYRGSLLAFAAIFGDAHIWSNGLMQRARSWPGYFVADVDGTIKVLPHDAMARDPLEFSSTARWSIVPKRCRALCDPPTLPVSSLTQRLASSPREAPKRG